MRCQAGASELQLISAREAAEAARELAERANEGKSRFLATASHDLRQPLQTLSLLNGSLRRLVTDPSATEALSQQEQAIGAMSRLLNALLDISKLESGAIRPEPTDFAVAAMFEELRGEFASNANSKGLKLDIDLCHERVHSDPTLVEQIVRNLLSNAIKYTRQGSVWLRCAHAIWRWCASKYVTPGSVLRPTRCPISAMSSTKSACPPTARAMGTGSG
jgi:signal transduction histidine kinase